MVAGHYELLRTVIIKRLAEQKDLNLRAIRAKLDGQLSQADFDTMKTSILVESGKIQNAITELDNEQSSYKALMGEAEREVVNFADAWRNGTLRRKQELQAALFEEGLQYTKSRVFELSNDLSIDDVSSVFDALLLDGVPDGI